MRTILFFSLLFLANLASASDWRSPTGARLLTPSGSEPSVGSEIRDLCFAYEQESCQGRRRQAAETLLSWIADNEGHPYAHGLALDLGIHLRDTGHIELAQQALSLALPGQDADWGAINGSKHASQLYGRAFLALLQTWAWVGQKEKVKELLGKYRGLQLTGSNLNNLKQLGFALSEMEMSESRAFKCGPYALSQLMEQAGVGDRDAEKAIDAITTGPSGTSLFDIKSLSQEVGFPLTPVFIDLDEHANSLPSTGIIHWKLNHFSALLALAEESKSALVHDETLQGMLPTRRWIDLQAILREGSGYFLVAASELSPEMRVIEDPDELRSVYGRGQLVGCETGDCPAVCPTCDETKPTDSKAKITDDTSTTSEDAGNDQTMQPPITIPHVPGLGGQPSPGGMLNNELIPPWQLRPDHVIEATAGMPAVGMHDFMASISIIDNWPVELYKNAQDEYEGIRLKAPNYPDMMVTWYAPGGGGYDLLLDSFHTETAVGMEDEFIFTSTEGDPNHGLVAEVRVRYVSGEQVRVRARLYSPESGGQLVYEEDYLTLSTSQGGVLRQLAELGLEDDALSVQSYWVWSATAAGTQGNVRQYFDGTVNRNDPWDISLLASNDQSFAKSDWGTDGQIQKVVAPDGRFCRFLYDDDLRLIAVRDQIGLDVTEGQGNHAHWVEAAHPELEGINWSRWSAVFDYLPTGELIDMYTPYGRTSFVEFTESTVPVGVDVGSDSFTRIESNFDRFSAVVVAWPTDPSSENPSITRTDVVLKIPETKVTTNTFFAGYSESPKSVYESSEPEPAHFEQFLTYSDFRDYLQGMRFSGVDPHDNVTFSRTHFGIGFKWSSNVMKHSRGVEIPTLHAKPEVNFAQLRNLTDMHVVDFAQADICRYRERKSILQNAKSWEAKLGSPRVQFFYEDTTGEEGDGNNEYDYGPRAKTPSRIRIPAMQHQSFSVFRDEEQFKGIGPILSQQYVEYDDISIASGVLFQSDLVEESTDIDTSVQLLPAITYATQFDVGSNDGAENNIKAPGMSLPLAEMKNVAITGIMEWDDQNRLEARLSGAGHKELFTYRDDNDPDSQLRSHTWEPLYGDAITTNIWYGQEDPATANVLNLQALQRPEAELMQRLAPGEANRAYVQPEDLPAIITDSDGMVMVLYYSFYSGGNNSGAIRPLPSAIQIRRPGFQVQTVDPKLWSTYVVVYDDLDRTTAIIFDDGSYTETVYDRLHVASTRDRTGRITKIASGLGRSPLAITDPLGLRTLMSYCSCGGLKTLTDVRGNKTSWLRNIASQVVQKLYAQAGGSQETIDYDYSLVTGQIASQVEQATGRVTAPIYNDSRRRLGTLLLDNQLTIEAQVIDRGDIFQRPRGRIFYEGDAAAWTGMLQAALELEYPDQSLNGPINIAGATAIWLEKLGSPSVDTEWQQIAKDAGCLVTSFSYYDVDHLMGGSDVPQQTIVSYLSFLRQNDPSGISGSIFQIDGHLPGDVDLWTFGRSVASDGVTTVTVVRGGSHAPLDNGFTTVSTNQGSAVAQIVLNEKGRLESIGDDLTTFTATYASDVEHLAEYWLLEELNDVNGLKLKFTYADQTDQFRLKVIGTYWNDLPIFQQSMDVYRYAGLLTQWTHMFGDGTVQSDRMTYLAGYDLLNQLSSLERYFIASDGLTSSQLRAEHYFYDGAGNRLWSQSQSRPGDVYGQSHGSSHADDGKWYVRKRSHSNALNQTDAEDLNRSTVFVRGEVNRLLDVRSTQLLTSEGTAFASSQMNQFENPETKHLQSRTTNPLTGSTTIGAFFDVNDVQSGFIYDNLKYQAGVRGLAPEGHKERWIDTQLTWDLPPVYFEPASFAGYDEIGRTKTIGDRTFSWNDRDLIEEISWIDGRKLTFKHDGSGNCYRIDRYLVGGAFDRTDILVWNGSKVAARYLLEDDGELKLQRTYFAAGHIDHGENGTLNDKFFYAKDHLGSPRVVFQEQDDSFVERARYDYDAFGNRVLLSGGAPAAQLDCGFTGHYYLPEAKLYLTHFRLYDPGLGRWLTREPLGEGASLNLYRYCHNDPVNYWDPNGLFELRFSHNFTEEERVLITQLMDNMLAQVRSLLAESESLLQEMNQNPSCFGSLIDDLGKAKKIFEGMEKGLAGDEVLRFYRRASIPSKNKGQANARWRPYYGLKNIDLNNREGGALRNRDLVELSLSLFHEISHYAGSEDPEFGLIWDFIPHDFENAYNLQELHNRPLKNWLNFGPAYRRSKRECEGSSGETE